MPWRFNVWVAVVLFAATKPLWLGHYRVKDLFFKNFIFLEFLPIWNVMQTQDDEPILG